MGTNLFLYSYEVDFIPFEKQNTTAMYVSYLDIQLEIDCGDWLRTKLHDKRDRVTFPTGNFPFICRNIPSGSAYVEYVCQLILYSRACGSYHDYFDRDKNKNY
jgi:hypothetical protein